MFYFNFRERHSCWQKVVVVELQFEVHSKHLWSCWDGQSPNHTFFGQP